MTNEHSFRRFAAVCAIISFPVALASNGLQGLPTNFNSDVFTNPATMLAIGASGASLIRWGLVLDIFGYYLLLLPIALVLQRWCTPRNPAWVWFYTLCGLGYILIGAAGAAALAAVHPPLITAYAQESSAAQRAILESVFISMWNLIYGALWNILGELLAGLWLLGIGWQLRSERRIFSVFSLIVGVSALLDSCGTMFSVNALASGGLLVFVALLPFWALWLGIDLLRQD